MQTTTTDVLMQRARSAHQKVQARHHWLLKVMLQRTKCTAIAEAGHRAALGACAMHTRLTPAADLGLVQRH